MVEKLREVQLLARENFGPGKAGESAFRIISLGAFCETRLDDGKPCGEVAKQTLDFDIIGELEQMPVCGLGHRSIEVNRINEELRAEGRNTIPGFNGFGRA